MHIPYLASDDAGTCLIVDGKPFLPLGGELHNSAGSDLAHMERVVWPSLRQLGGNFYLSPVYWELMEPEQGVYDFTLVDGLIRQARREGVRLGLLWFGLWKNGASDYVPQWMKRDHRQYFLFRRGDGKPAYTISPFCAKAVDRDRTAFAALMRHLKETDGEAHTVIVVQVENEIGVWDSDRDYGPEAEAAYCGEIPGDLAEAMCVHGNYEEAFGKRACDVFMSYHYAKAVERITAAGKAEYPLPMFVNAVVEHVASRPVGAPDAPVHDIWMRFTPSIDFYSPDIYVPWFGDIVDAYHHAGNPLFIPETGAHKDTCSNLIYAVGRHNCFGFAPFAIERLFMEEDPLDPYARRRGFQPDRISALCLKGTYGFLQALWPEIREAHAEGRIHAYLQQSSDVRHAPGEVERRAKTFEIQSYRFRINYGSPEADEKTPTAAGMIIERGPDEFLFFGVNSSVTIEPKEGRTGTVFVSDKWEYRLEGGSLVRGRCLNGDERETTGCSLAPGEFSFRVECF